MAAASCAVQFGVQVWVCVVLIVCCMGLGVESRHAPHTLRNQVKRPTAQPTGHGANSRPSAAAAVASSGGAYAPPVTVALAPEDRWQPGAAWMQGVKFPPPRTKNNTIALGGALQYTVDLLMKHVGIELEAISRDMGEGPPFIMINSGHAASLHSELRNAIFHFEQPNMVAGGGIRPTRIEGDSQEERVRILNTLLAPIYDVSKWDVVFTLDPFTAKWVNSIMGYRHHVPIYYPFASWLVQPLVPPEGRQYDIFFCGSLNHFGPILEALRGVRTGFKVMRMGRSKRADVTHASTRSGMRYKLQMSSLTRITLIHNVLLQEAKDPIHAGVMQAALHPEAKFAESLALTNGAFREWFDPVLRAEAMGRGYLRSPQLKERVFDAAITGSLMLVYNDTFNVIEDFFTPNVHFLYWNTPDEFVALSRKICNNFTAYYPIVEAARQHALTRYSSAHFVSQFIKPLFELNGDKWPVKK